MTVCARATSWVSALMNFLTTQWVFIIDFNLWDPCSHMYVILCFGGNLSTPNYESNLKEKKLWVKLCIYMYNDFLTTASKGAIVLLLSYRILRAIPLKLDSCDTVIVIFYSQIWPLLQGDKMYIYIHNYTVHVCTCVCIKP